MNKIEIEIKAKMKSCKTYIIFIGTKSKLDRKTWTSLKQGLYLQKKNSLFLIGCIH